MITELQELIQIKTEYDPETITKQNPVGQKIAEGLAYIERVAQNDGFKTKNIDGYALAILYGEQSNRIEAVSHIDVVPVLGGWTIPPYEGRLVGNRLYGRGTQDMKVALWLTYTALRQIKNEKIVLKRQVRVVVGVDEERTMTDIEYYLDKEGYPDFAFTPDAAFPICLGEKGALSWLMESKISTRVIKLSAGSVSNVICDSVTVSLETKDADCLYNVCQTLGISVKRNRDDIVIQGKSSHTSRPDDGINAITLFLKAFTKAFSEDWSKTLFQAFKDDFGGGFGFDKHYEPMGFISACLNVLRIIDGNLTGEIDVRFPTPLKQMDVIDTIETKLEGFEMSLRYQEEPMQVSIDDDYVKICLDAYRSVYPNDKSKPFYSGGVTYAKKYKGRAVAFGNFLAHQGTPNLAHQVDEYIEIDELDKLVEVYKKALINCANKE